MMTSAGLRNNFVVLSLAASLFLTMLPSVNTLGTFFFGMQLSALNSSPTSVLETHQTNHALPPKGRGV